MAILNCYQILDLFLLLFFFLFFLLPSIGQLLDSSHKGHPGSPLLQKPCRVTPIHKKKAEPLSLL